MDRTRAAFPNTIVRDPQPDLLVGFETIRQSRHVVVGVSTFACLAAWLSRTADNTFMTVNGLFDPRQTSQVDLLPFGDARYRQADGAGLRAHYIRWRRSSGDRAIVRMRCIIIGRSARPADTGRFPPLTNLDAKS